MIGFRYHASALAGVSVFSGNEVVEPSPLQFHSDLEVGVVQEGVVRILHPKGSELAGPGDTVLIPPQIAHQVEVIERCTFRVAYVPPTLARSLGLGPMANVPLQIMNNTAPEVLALASGLTSTNDARECRGHVRKALLALGARPSEPELREHEFTEVCSYLRANVARLPRLEEVAEVAGLSKWHFARAFKLETGLSPLAYHRQLRLLEARERLSTGHAVHEVALDLGFSDGPHLSRSFRKTFKVDPRRYRSAFRPK